MEYSLYKTNRIENAVWIAGIIQAYERFQLLKANEIEKTLDDFYFSGQIIINNVNKFIRKKLNPSLRIEEFIGNEIGNKYNYLLINKEEVRVSKLNEFFGHKVCPLKFEKDMLIETSYGKLCIEDLIEWYIYEYNVLL